MVFDKLNRVCRSALFCNKIVYSIGIEAIHGFLINSGKIAAIFDRALVPSIRILKQMVAMQFQPDIWHPSMPWNRDCI